MSYDVAIVGGGPAASVTALVLGRAGVRTVILERGDDCGDKPGESIAPAARPLLEHLGWWADRARDGHRPCHGNRSSWGADSVDELPFVFSPYGHGWHLDRRRFEHRLNEHATRAGAERRTGTRVVRARRTRGGWWLQCAGGENVSARFVVDATGRASWLAHRAGARRIVDDRLVAVVAFLRGVPTADSFTLVEAVENGWWYTAPVPDGRLAAMFITDPTVVRPPADFNALLAAAPYTRDRCGAAAHGGAPRWVDAGSSRLDRVAGDDWLAVGDAALALDPLSSHGLGSAIFGGMEAAKAIVDENTDRYAAKIYSVWNGYVSRRHKTYSLERRWPDAPFWQRRVA